jgi:hypothetical protein
MDDILTPTQRYVRDNRDEILKMLKNGDQTLRVLAIAVLLEGGANEDIEKVRRELELLEEVDDWRKFE